MPLNITQVDAFTNKPFAGNPAAICVTEHPLADELMQAIAAEMNLSETAFLYPVESGYSLRWFSPAVEVDLCGHATLASAHVLWSEGHLASTEVAKFNTKSGWLSAQKITKAADHTTNGATEDWIQMDFPVQPVKTSQENLPQLVQALCCGDTIHTVAKNDVNYLVELQSETALTALNPDFVAVGKLPLQGIIATAPADRDEYDFVSRYFCPAIGVNEDPVTGSAHASLAPYWQEKLGKTAMKARQISQRGGVLHVSCEEDNRVKISGQAVTVVKGELQL